MVPRLAQGAEELSGGVDAVAGGAVAVVGHLYFTRAVSASWPRGTHIPAM